MILQNIFSYIYDRKFIYQLVVSFVAYFGIRLFQLVRYRIERQTIFENFGIPGPKPSLIDGLYRVYTAPNERGQRTLHKVEERLMKEYGSFYGTFIGDEASIIITDLDVLKKVFFEESKSFGERNRLFLSIPLEDGILFAKYPRWKAMRKMLSPFFNKYSMRGVSSTKFIEESLKLMFGYIEQKLLEAKTNNSKANIDIHELMKATALHLISTMAIRLPNVEVKENEPNVHSLDQFLKNSDRGVVVVSIICPLFKPLVGFLARHFEHNGTLGQVWRGLNKIIDDNLKKKKNKNPHGTESQQIQVIDLMIRLHREGKLSREEVLANAESILFAGYDTTSTTLAYILWVLSKYPDIQERLRTEIVAHGVDSEYLIQVIKETMRLYPTVISFTTRICTETVKVNQWTIPAGCKVIYNAWLMNRNPNIWSEPDKFIPERFYKGLELHPCAYAPFGMGDRLCLGYQLAMLEMKMIICDLLLRYRTRLISPNNLEIISYAVTLTKPSEKVMLEFEKL